MVDRWLIEEQDGTDAFADLDDFIVAEEEEEEEELEVRQSYCACGSQSVRRR